MSAAPVLNVVVTGGSGPSGIATARALHDAGHKVFTVGSDGPRIEAAAAQAGGSVTPLVCDLASLAGVRALHAEINSRAGRVDGVIHLVGGWRGAKGIADQTDEDWDFLERSAITTVRNVTRVFYGDLAASGTGRFAMVSSTAVSSPTAATASYVAAKAAAEAWTLAMADGLSRDQPAPTAPEAGTGGPGVSGVPDANINGATRSTAGGEIAAPAGLRSAAVVLVVKALVDAGMRAKSPGRRFPGFTDVEDLAAAVVGLFTTPAAELNGQRLLLNR